MADLTPSQMDSKLSDNKADVDLDEKVGQLRINGGTNVPLLLTNFEASCFPQEYIRKLYEAGFKKPTQIQARLWPIAMQGKDIISVARSGSGKKLGFIIPAFIYLKRIKNDPKKGPTVLVVCPTDDITTQVHNESVKFAPAGIKITCLHGEVVKVPQLDMEIAADVVVATLERLIDILESEKLSLEQVSYLVLYKANKLLTVSADPLIHKVLPHLPSKHCQTLVFTTTWSKEAEDMTSVFLHDPFIVSVINTNEFGVTESGIDLEGLSGSSNALVPKELGALIKKKLLVLDINGILADFVMLDSIYSQPEHITISRKAVFKRPFCADFLKFCFANFEVGIWSSRNKYNLDKAVDYLIGDLKDNLLFCWDQSKCTTTNLKARDNKLKPIFFKELMKLWEKVETGLPWPKGRFTKANTLLIDDSPYKGLCNPRFTAIFPHPYSSENKEDKSLGLEGDLRLYLEKVATAEDVQCFVKDNPFGQPAMTESHPDWNYYLPAMRTLQNP